MAATSVQIVLDCQDPASLAEFWAKALHYQLQDPPTGFATWEAFLESIGMPPERWNDASAIMDPAGVGPRLYFQRVPEPKTLKNRLHLDLNISGGRGVAPEERRSRVQTEAHRLVNVGATSHGESMGEFGEFWIIMQDPEGNEFCVH